jgi:hypothetical protein
MSTIEKGKYHNSGSTCIEQFFPFWKSMFRS